MKCKYCGLEVNKSDNFCGKCGKKLIQFKGEDTVVANNQYAEKYSRSLNTNNNEYLSEIKVFLKNTFTNLDQEFSSTHTYSYKFIASLVGMAVLLLLFFLLIIVPVNISLFGPSKSLIILSVLFSAIISSALLFGVTIGIVKLLNINISMHKIISDLIVINLFSTIFFFVGLLSILINVPGFPMILILLSILLFMTSPIYLIIKYSNYYSLRIQVMYGIIIYLIIVSLILCILKQKSISDSLDIVNLLCTGY